MMLRADGAELRIAGAGTDVRGDGSNAAGPRR